jgi:hypothetical protein
MASEYPDIIQVIKYRGEDRKMLVQLEIRADEKRVGAADASRKIERNWV